MATSVARTFYYADVLEKVPIEIMKGKWLLSHDGGLQNLMVSNLWSTQKAGKLAHMGVIYTA